MGKKIIGVILCIALAIIFICLLIKDNKVENVNIYAENTELVENIIENDIEENNLEENVLLENKVSNETIQNSVVQDNLISSPEKNAYESESNVGTTSKKQEAINMVKDYWGEDDTVSFSCDSVTSNGEYIIAVTSLKTASVSGYFRVNLEKKTVEVDY